MVVPEDNVKNTYLITTIDFQDSIGKCKVELYDYDECNIVPHMHIFNDDKSFECCVCIYSNEYYSHGGKYKNKFNKEQCNIFDQWMKLQSKNSVVPLSNWQGAVGTWNIANPSYKPPKKFKNIVQPNYKNMIEFIEK